LDITTPLGPVHPAQKGKQAENSRFHGAQPTISEAGPYCAAGAGDAAVEGLIFTACGCGWSIVRTCAIVASICALASVSFGFHSSRTANFF
jgi:hypothetical protein